MPEDWLGGPRRQKRTQSLQSPQGPQLMRRKSTASLQLMLKQVENRVHQEYLRFFFLPNIHPRIIAAANRLAWKFHRRHRAGSAEFELEAEDLIQHAFEILVRSGIRFPDPLSFLDAFVDRMQNYERAQRRRLKSKVRVDGTAETLDRQPATASVHSQPEPSPEALAIDRDALARLHRAVCADAPDLEPLLLLMFRGMLHRGDLAVALDITPEALDLKRRRLNRLARNILIS